MTRVTPVIWDIYNTTGDTHPMHFHLVNVQVLGRASFDASIPNILTFQPSSYFTPPDPNYRGWKETVRMNPGEVTRVIMKFDLPHGAVRRSAQRASRPAEWRPRICVALPHPGARRARHDASIACQAK